MKPDEAGRRCIAFKGSESIATGRLRDVILAAKRVSDADPSASILFFDETTSDPIEVDLRGSDDELRRRYETSPHEGAAVDGSGSAPLEGGARGPGRPKLGVVAREVTLLPRHWEWLATQPGGASVAIRRLVEEARRSSGYGDRRRRAQESTYRFMTAMAGDLPGFEEATRSLFASDSERFDGFIAGWPADIRDHAWRLARSVFDDESR